MNEVCKIKSFMMSITLGSGLIWHLWFTRVIPLASKGRFTRVRTVGMGPSGATIATVMYPTSLRSQQFPNVLQALYAVEKKTDLGHKFTFALQPMAPLWHPSYSLPLQSLPSKNLNHLNGSGSARNIGFPNFFLSPLYFSLIFIFFKFLLFSFPYFFWFYFLFNIFLLFFSLSFIFSFSPFSYLLLPSLPCFIKNSFSFLLLSSFSSLSVLPPPSSTFSELGVFKEGRKKINRVFA